MNRRQLLCVDDDPSTLEIRKLLLESNGYSVLTATSAEQALQFLSATDVDLLLVDYIMPGMKGDQLAETVRSQFPSLPVIAVSGVEQLPERFLDNIDARVSKGADPELLLSVVAETLSGEGAFTLHQDQRVVLCVEDDDLELKARKSLFEAAGFKVLEARSKSSALQAFQSNAVDVVVLDYWLSGAGGNGTAVAEEIKRLSPLTPVLMLSGYGSLPGEDAIVDAWMSKARTDPAYLLREVERLIEQRRSRVNNAK